jgi:hypothetical protein
MDLARMREGKISMYHMYWDGLAILRQLGLLAPWHHAHDHTNPAFLRADAPTSDTGPPMAPSPPEGPQHMFTGHLRLITGSRRAPFPGRGQRPQTRAKGPHPPANAASVGGGTPAREGRDSQVPGDSMVLFSRRVNEAFILSVTQSIRLRRGGMRQNAPP